MADAEVIEPLPCREAFKQTSREALLSQAALLLQFGGQLRGDEHALKALARASRRGALMESISAEDLARLGMPRLRRGPRRFAAQSLREAMAKRYGAEVFGPSAEPAEPARFTSVLSDLVETVYKLETFDAAARLIEACMRHPEELPRLAAASSRLGIISEPRRALEIIESCIDSSDHLVSEMATAALGRFNPEHPRLAGLMKAPDPLSGGGETRTSLLVHGTFARQSSWWQPGGNFHEYVRTAVRADLYTLRDAFSWSGGFSDAAREIGAHDLETWLAGHQAHRPFLITHSHGGSVAMRASENGVEIDELVLLSCPVFVNRYMPDFGRVGTTVSIRVHLDLVILLIGGGQRFRDPRIREEVLPVWFDHSATHDPDVWRKYDVPSKL